MSFAVLTVTVSSEWEDYQTLEDMHSFKGSLVTSYFHSTEQCSCRCSFHALSLLFSLFLFQGGMCWVKLNVFYLEESLQDLAHKFGNISSNRKDISIFIQMLQELRLNLGTLVSWHHCCTMNIWFHPKTDGKQLSLIGKINSCVSLFGHHNERFSQARCTSLSNQGGQEEKRDNRHGEHIQP